MLVRNLFDEFILKTPLASSPNCVIKVKNPIIPGDDRNPLEVLDMRVLDKLNFTLMTQLGKRIELEDKSGFNLDKEM